MVDDLIKRRYAIDAIENITWYHQNANKDMICGANSEEHQAWYKVEDVYKALNCIPSAQPVLTCKGCKYDYYEYAGCRNCLRKERDLYEPE